ncbi:MAG: S8 family serine peptidase, partial [Candidatus Hydrogenedens sp.]|nr:S8 family serine peptidase [Candidatus Hydrogenedens sp.]
MPDAGMARLRAAVLALAVVVSGFFCMAEGPYPARETLERVAFDREALAGEVASLLQGKAGDAEAEVIVTLAQPPVPNAVTGESGAARRGRFRAANGEKAANVLSRISPAGFRERHRFENFAGFTGRVSKAGLQELLADPEVLYVEPVRILEPHLAQGIPLMNAATVRSTHNGAGVAVAVCDTGVDYTHPMLGNGGFPNGKVIGGYDFGNNDANPAPKKEAHGTCCAGIVAGGTGTVGDYIGGVAHGAKLYALKITTDTSGSASSAAMVSAWDWCVTHQNDDPANPLMVISTSFGGGRYYSAASADAASPSMTLAAGNAAAAGITVLASSGNEGYCDSMSWPAGISTVFSVGAVYDAGIGTYYPCVEAGSCAPKTATTGCTSGYYASDATAADKVTAYSNSAPFLTLFAPSNACYTTDITGPTGYAAGDYYTSFGGTSAACPYAAGAVACLQSAAKALLGRHLSVAEVRELLVSTGQNVTDTKVALTRPRVDLGAAVAALTASLPRIELDTSTLLPVCAAGENAPSQSFTVRNAGAGTLNYSISTGGAAWLSVDPSSGASTGEADTITVNYATAGLSTGTHSAVISVADPAATNSPRTIGVTLTVRPTLAAALDNAALEWATSGGAAWHGQTAFSHDGQDAAQSGAVGDNAFSALQTQVTGPATVSFWWRVDSEEDYDFLEFHVDGEPQAAISGLLDWAQETHSLGEGVHTLEWVYSKDTYVFSGLDAGWVDQVSVEYPPLQGSVQVTLEPAGAVSAGAQWRVDGGAWQNSGATVSGLSVGGHTVSFKEVAGWNTPQDQSLPVLANQTATASGTYIQQTGALTVNLGPTAAVSAGAQWRVDGGAWQNSGATVSGLSVGSHTVSFKEVAGWNTPQDQSLPVLANQTATATGTYIQQTGALTVSLGPAAAVSAGAQWRVDGGAWQNSGATVSGLSVGGHTVSFKEVAGWNTPQDQSLPVLANQTATASGTYVQQTGALTVSLGPAAAVSAGAQWRVDGGAWQNSGATVSGLSVGSHTVS